jgi:hypothetical protein
MVIGVLLSFGLGFVINDVYFQKSKTFTLKTANIQRLREIPRLNKFPFRISEGNNIFEIGGPRTFSFMKVGPHELSIRVTPERSIFLNVEIRDETGATVAELKDSQLFVLRGVDYDVNSDRSGFEVVDERLLPVLQIYRRDDLETLQVNYVTFFKHAGDRSVRVLVCHEGGCEGGTRAVGGQARNALKRIFRYPGHEYPGVRFQK